MATLKSVSRSQKKQSGASLPKASTGIHGLDEITLGGLPAGRPTLVCGGAGCGKTLFGIEFLIRGATKYDEPGVCLSFEETQEDLSSNVASLGFKIDELVSSGKLAIDHIFIERSLTEETGDYDLEALFLRLGHAINSVKAKRVVLDSIETLFAGFSNEAVLRAEIRRLFRWLKDNNLTTVVTAERGDETLTRFGIEEYIADCVILLDHRVIDSVTTRRLRVVKYRGSSHGTNEYPFLIDTDGISVLPVTSLDLNHKATNDKVSSGLKELDAMLGGEGFFRGSTVLFSGTSGTGKTSISSHFVNAACARGERCIMFSFEESSEQVIRNMRSIGIDLQQWVDKGLLLFHAARPLTFGLEMHLVKIHKIVADFKPAHITVDPVTALLHSGATSETRSMLLRLVDFLKSQQITALLTTLTNAADPAEQTEVDISSVVDTWILLRDIESGGERNRGIYVLKARGLCHSNQIREYVITNRGIDFCDVYLGSAGLLTGSARMAHEANEAAKQALFYEELQKKKAILQRHSKHLEAQIAELQMDLATESRELEQLVAQEAQRLDRLAEDQAAMARSRRSTQPRESNNSSKGGHRK